MEQAAGRGQRRTTSVEAWREASRQLQERGRLAWALSEALGQVLDGAGWDQDGDCIRRLEAIVQRAVRDVVSGVAPFPCRLGVGGWWPSRFPPFVSRMPGKRC